MSIAENRFQIAKAEIGVHETRGGETKRILEYHATTTLRAQEDEVSWCSAFVNWVVKKNGEEGTNLANARSWLDWGESLKQPEVGCIVVLKRGDPPSGHVGFYAGAGKDIDHILVLGGNQSDQVKFSQFPKSLVLDYRG